MGSMKFLQWLQTMWRDSNMRWDPSEFENVISTHIPSKALWRPDIAVYNQMVEIEYPQAREDILAEVFYDGTVKLVYLQALEIRCHGFDLSQFPFDQQTCTTRYGSWAQSNEQILLTTGKVIEQDNQFRNHSEWDIVSFIGRTEDVTYSSKILLRNPNGTERLLNDTKIFRELHYDLTLKRKASFYIFTLVLPSIITTTICLIGLFAPFDASGNREEK
uniref:Neurotransmitter-gated ion-channel ligand-binding domain-containing protein n=1 Tax=Plectus sambesii TaxID=2011161 RepID=A0A914X761_9BILA